MKSDLRISVKDYRRNKNLKILLVRADFTHRQFFVRKELVKSAGSTPASHPSDQTNRLLNPLK